MILLMGQEADPSIGLVRDRLEGRGVDVAFIDTFDLGHSGTVSARLQDGGWSTDFIAPTGPGPADIALSEVSGIWYHRPRIPVAAAEGITVAERAFVSEEFRLAIGGLMTCCDARWVNPPMAQARAMYKPFQLALAREIGLTVPDTTITSDPDVAVEFCDGGRTILKSFQGGLPVSAEGHMIGMFTATVTSADLERVREQIRRAPLLLQREVSKARELRIAVVDGSVLAGSIDSQNLDGAQSDWRKPKRLPWSIASVPSEVSEKICTLIQRLGLVSGIVDMVVTPEEQHVFLEVNPEAQWYMLEDAGLPVADAYAAALSRSADGLD